MTANKEHFLNDQEQPPQRMFPDKPG